jgi:small subunit ribosomal protein S6
VACGEPLIALGVRVVALGLAAHERCGRRHPVVTALANAKPSCHGKTVAALSPEEVETAVRAYEVMVILDPSLDERTVQPSLDKYLDNVIRKSGGSVDNIDVWGRRRLAYEIKKNAEGIYAVITLTAEPDSVKELDRQFSLNESILRTKVQRAVDAS